MKSIKTENIEICGGYHHFIDVGFSGVSSRDINILIDGGTVRLIRLGTVTRSIARTELSNVNITVNSGELWYLNISGYIDGISGGVQIVFNNGTFAHFLSDYSLPKIIPQRGRWFLDSPWCDGVTIGISETVGTFLVYGNKTAYAFSGDMRTIYYSYRNRLTLPCGTYKIGYSEQFSLDTLTFGEKKNYVWCDNGRGTVISREAPAAQELYVDAIRGLDTNEGSKISPLKTVREAAGRLKATGGTIVISGKAEFSSYPAHTGLITYKGATPEAQLTFPQGYYYYLQGPTIFENITLYHNTADASVVSNGYFLGYKGNINHSEYIYSIYGNNDIGKSGTLSVCAVYFSDGSDLEGKRNPEHCCMYYIIVGKIKVGTGAKEMVLSQGTVWFCAPNKSLKLILVHAGEPVRMLCVEFTASQDVNPENFNKIIPQKNTRQLVGEITEQINANPVEEENAHLFNRLEKELSALLMLDTSHEDIAARIVGYIDMNFIDDITVEKIAAEFHMNRSYITRIFKRVHGCGIKQYIIHRRMEYAKELLTRGISVKETAAKIGYKNAFDFSSAFKKETGQAPMPYVHCMMK